MNKIVYKRSNQRCIIFIQLFKFQYETFVFKSTEKVILIKPLSTLFKMFLRQLKGEYQN